MPFFGSFTHQTPSFGPESKSEQWFANRKLEEKRIFSLQNLEETKTCCTFAIANGTGSGKTEIKSCSRLLEIR